MDGFSELGAALGGMGQNQAASYQNGVLRGAQGANLLEEARQRRNKNLAMSSITPAIIAAAQADPTGQGASELFAAATQAGVDPRQLAESFKTEQGVGWGNQAMAAATAPNADVNLINRINMVRNGKPVALSGVQGNTLLSTMVTPDQQAAVGGNVPTAVGQSDITAALARAGASQAQAADSYAGAGEHNAHSRLFDTQTAAGGFNPNTGGREAGGGKVAPSTYTAAFGGTSSTGKPNQQMQEFLAYQALHPEMNDAEALKTFMLAKTNAPTGNFGSATNPTGGISDAPATLGEALGGGPAPADANAGVAVKPAPASTSGPAMPKSQADFDQLPAGTQFINPSDGKLMVKK